MKRLLQMQFIPTNLDLGLLVLRVSVAFTLFLNHGWSKASNYSELATKFGDPIGVGPHFSLLFATTSDAICSVLIALGLATRWACAVNIINLSVALIFVHHFKLTTGPGSGEVAWLYLCVVIALFIVGPGRYSIDGGPRGEGSTSNS